MAPFKAAVVTIHTFCFCVVLVVISSRDGSSICWGVDAADTTTLNNRTSNNHVWYSKLLKFPTRKSSTEEKKQQQQPPQEQQHQQQQNEIVVPIKKSDLVDTANTRTSNRITAFNNRLWSKLFPKKQQKPQEQHQQQPKVPIIQSGGGSSSSSSNKQQPRCAFVFWGLPRAFDTLVLPSVIRNVIIPNRYYNCDYYAHFYALDYEKGGRSGKGGSVNATAIYMLQDAVRDVHNRTFEGKDHLTPDQQRLPLVEFVHDTEVDFWTRYETFIDKIRKTRDAEGNYFYFPYNDKTFIYPTTADNIVKMWHSIESGWKLMDSKGIPYEQVAMIRSDVMYVTPIDIFEIPGHPPPTNNGGKGKDKAKSAVVIPDFAKFPINDRFIYGQYEAVKIWASERFSRLDDHAAWVHEHDPGWAFHDEKFLQYTIFPAIVNATKADIVLHHTMCFLRARSDNTIQLSDCRGPARFTSPHIMKELCNDSYDKLQEIIEAIIEHPCGKIIPRKNNVKALDCSEQQSQQHSTITTTTIVTEAHGADNNRMDQNNQIVGLSKVDSLTRASDRPPKLVNDVQMVTATASSGVIVTNKVQK